MNKTLPPIGTKLITRKLTIASMCNDYFDDENMHSYWHDDKGAALIKALGDEPIKVKGFDPSADWWDINVTADNQALLGDELIENDILYPKIEYSKDDYSNHRTTLATVYKCVGMETLLQEGDGFKLGFRYYPHANATLPAITASMFDEVVLPEKEEEK